MVYKYGFFDKKSKGSGIKSEIKENHRSFLQTSQLPDELHKPIIKKFKKRKFILLLRTIFGVLI